MKSHIEKTLTGDICSFRLMAFVFGAFGAIMAYLLFWDMSVEFHASHAEFHYGAITIVGFFAVMVVTCLMGWQYSKGYRDGWVDCDPSGEAEPPLSPGFLGWRRSARVIDGGKT